VFRAWDFPFALLAAQGAIENFAIASVAFERKILHLMVI
jgi:hypothetical protein